jgi:hypothetical protein
VTKLSEDYGIRRLTVHDIKNNKMKFMEFVRDSVSGAKPSICKSMKKSSYKEVDAALLQ